MVEKACNDSPPRKNKAPSTSNVVIPVITVRLSIWFSERVLGSGALAVAAVVFEIYQSKKKK